MLLRATENTAASHMHCAGLQLDYTDITDWYGTSIAVHSGTL